MTFLGWARARANQYTRHFSMKWPNSMATAYFDAYFDAFAGFPELHFQDVAAAVTALSSNQTLLIWTKDLDKEWPRVASWLDGTRMGAALQQRLDTLMASHIDKNAGKYTYEPTPSEVQQARDIEGFDIELYRQLVGLKGSVEPQVQHGSGNRSEAGTFAGGTGASMTEASRVSATR